MTIRTDTAIVLAGGLGTRLRSAVPDLPKPMAPIAQRPFLEHLLDHWIAQGITRFVLSVGYRKEAISTHFGLNYCGAALEYSEEERPLGTGGAVLQAAQRLDLIAPALVLNGDTFFDVKLEQLDACANAHAAQWCFALFRSTDPTRYMGVQLGVGGRIEALRAPLSALANGGVYRFQPGALRDFELAANQTLSLENDVFPKLFAQGQRFVGVECSGAFIDIGVPDDYRRAASVLPQRSSLHIEHAIDN
jgi:D-glycero-alpha-D-manno-heptose 1-phosphate guanylyltransferase